VRTGPSVSLDAVLRRAFLVEIVAEDVVDDHQGKVLDDQPAHRLRAEVLQTTTSALRIFFASRAPAPPVAAK